MRSSDLDYQSSDTDSSLWTAEILKRKKPTQVRAELDRQIFNIDLSAAEFRRKAKDEEERSVQCKRRCSQNLKMMRKNEARRAAEEAIRAQNEAFIYNLAAEKLKAFYKTISSIDDPEPSLQKAINRVDVAVRGYDALGAIQQLSVVEEKMDRERKEMLKVAEMEPLEEDIEAFLEHVSNRNAVANELDSPSESPELRTSSSSAGGRKYSSKGYSNRYSSDSQRRKSTGSSQTPVDSRLTKKHVRRGTSMAPSREYEKEVRFQL